MGSGSAGEKPQVVVVGSYMRDLFMRVDVFPAPGETRFGHGHFTADGGKGSNQAVQAVRCGARVAMVAAVGGDENGRGALELWEGEGIDTTCVAVRPDRATGVAMILVDAKGENRIVIDAGANLSVSPADIERAADLIAGADIVVAQLEVPVPAVYRAFEIARTSNAATLLNAAPALQADIADLLDLTDILVVNEVEAAALTGVSDVLDVDTGRKMAARLAPATLVVTAGAEGAYLFDPSNDGLHRQPPDVGAIVDTTGAGDAFIGAFTAKWLEARDTAAALCQGLAAGSLACTAAGALPSFAGLDRIRQSVDGR